MKIKLLIIFGFLFSVTANADETVTVEDPYLVAKEKTGSLSLRRFFLDINADKRPELFVAAHSTCGKSSCRYHIFSEQTDGKFLSLGNVVLSELSFSLLPPGVDGINGITTRLAHSACEFNLVEYAYKKGSFYEHTTQAVDDCTDDGKRRSIAKEDKVHVSIEYSDGSTPLLWGSEPLEFKNEKWQRTHSVPGDVTPFY